MKMKLRKKTHLEVCSKLQTIARQERIANGRNGAINASLAGKIIDNKWWQCVKWISLHYCSIKLDLGAGPTVQPTCFRRDPRDHFYRNSMTCCKKTRQCHTHTIYNKTVTKHRPMTSMCNILIRFGNKLGKLNMPVLLNWRNYITA